MQMPDTPQPRSPPIFTIRLWQEAVDADLVEWRGEIKNVSSGEVRYFRDWSMLAQLLPRMLGDGPTDDPTGENPDW
jgi:hypothetical protein